MQLQIALFVVGLLEQDVGADSGFLQFTVVLHGGCGNVDVHAADVTVFMMDGIDCFDGFQNVLDRVIDRVLPGFNGQALVTHILQGNDFASDLFLGKLDAGNVFVFHMIRAVHTAVDAVVGEIERGKHDDAVAVEGLLDLLSQLVHLCNLFRNVAGQQHRCLPVGESGTVGLGAVGTFDRSCFCQDFVDQGQVVFVFLRVADGVEDFLMVDEFLCL